MFKWLFNPRKQRTRQHVIADQSIHHVKGFVLDEGHTAQEVSRDYGYDLVVTTYDLEGFLEPGMVLFQVKATETLRAFSNCYVYDVDIRDYNTWITERNPVILVLFEASRRKACWLAIQKYFRENITHRPKTGAKTVRVRVPIRQVLNRRAIKVMRELKREAHLPAIGGDS
jgi:hypothetical protein